MSLRYVLAIDIGTSSARASIFNSSGAAITPTFSQRSYSVEVDSTGRATLDPAHLTSAVSACIDDALCAFARHSPQGAKIDAIGTSCFWHSLLGISGNENMGYSAATPIFTWADSRSRSSATALRSRLNEREIHARTGCMLRSSFWPAKLLWLTTTSLSYKVSFWTGPAEYILNKLFARPPVMGVSSASATGMFANGAWDAGLLEAIGLAPSLLPILDDTASPASSRWPQLDGAAVLAPLGDGAAGNLGSGADTPGTAALNFGTSAAVRVVVPNGTPTPFGLFNYQVDAHRRVIGGALSNAGNLHEWCSKTLQIPRDMDALEAELSKRSSPPASLTVLPFLVAERSPTWPEEIPSVITGITAATSALDLYQALQESVFQRLAQILDLLPTPEASGERRIIVSGGLSRSRAAMQRLANVMQHTTERCTEAEASLRGAALHALAHLGIAAPPPERGETYLPNPEVSARYLELRRRQAALENLFS